jgi:hypothetical protein
MNFLTSWKTTALGAAAILVAAADMLHQFGSGEWDGNRLYADYTAISSGVIGLFAKDFNVSGK